MPSKEFEQWIGTWIDSEPESLRAAPHYENETYARRRADQQPPWLWGWVAPL